MRSSIHEKRVPVVSSPSASAGALTSLAVCFGILSTCASSMAATLYDTDFSTGAGPEWSSQGTLTTPNGANRYIGDFQQQSLILSLAGLPPHSDVVIDFDLYVIGTWDGSHAGSGPDIWEAYIGSTRLVRTTFSNVYFSVFYNEPENQSFPDAYGSGSHPAGSGATAINALGFPPFDTGMYGDAVYHFHLELAHTSSSLQATFSGLNMTVSSPADTERWGIDNVVVSATLIPEPSASLVIGLIGLPLLSRRRRNA